MRAPDFNAISRRQKAARENGSEGGLERASRYEDVILSEWASWGGKKVLEKYGRAYFVALRKRRKHYPKYSESPVIQMSPRVLAGKTNGRRGGDVTATSSFARSEKSAGTTGRATSRVGRRSG